MLQLFRGILAFIVGMGAARIFDMHFPPTGKDVAPWVTFVVTSGALYIASYWREIRRRLWLIRTPMMRVAMPLRITHQLGLHDFLADEGENGTPQYRLLADQDDKVRPPVSEGDRVIVTGKQRERMRGGSYTLVQCRIRTLR